MRKLGIIDLLKLNYLCIVETVSENLFTSESQLHASASLVSTQIVTGPAILWAMQIKRRISITILFNKLIH